MLQTEKFQEMGDPVPSRNPGIPAERARKGPTGSPPRQSDPTDKMPLPRMPLDARRPARDSRSRFSAIFRFWHSWHSLPVAFMAWYPV